MLPYNASLTPTKRSTLTLRQFRRSSVAAVSQHFFATFRRESVASFSVIAQRQHPTLFVNGVGIGG